MGVTAAEPAGVGLVERDGELAQIDLGLDAARDGSGGVLLIEGPAGIGKTSLVASARAAAGGRGMTVLHARGTPLECDYAMGIVRQALGPAVREASDPSELFAGAAALARSVVLDADDGVQTPPLGVLHGLHWLVANVARSGPLLLAVDDLHWADPPSLRFLAYLCRRIESLGVFVVLAARETEGDGGAAELIGEIRAEPSIAVARPRPLGLAGIETILERGAARPVETALARACMDASGGNPFLLTELVRALRDGRAAVDAGGAQAIQGVALPTVSRRVRTALGRIGPEGRALARALTVLGDGADLDVAAELAGIPLSGAAMTAVELAREGVLDRGPELRFLHPLLAAAVRSDIPAHELSGLHARAASLLRARGAGVERVALHLLHATPAGDQSVVEELLEAAASARRRGAPATAAGLARRALAEPPPRSRRASVLLDLGQDEYAVGRTAEAATHLEEAFRCATDPILRGRAVMALFQARAGDFSAQRGLEPLFEQTVPEVLALDRELGLRLWTLKLLAIEPGPRWIEAARSVEALPCETPGEAVLLSHCALPIVNRGTDARTLAAVAIRAAQHVDALLEEGATSLVMTGVVLGLLWSERYEQAADVLDRAIAVAQRRGAIRDVALAHQFRAMVRRASGRLRDAEADAQTALAAAAESGWGGAGRAAVAVLVDALVDQGRLDEAAAEIDGPEEVPDAPAMSMLLVARMRLRTARGEHRRALADWAEARRRAERHFTGIDPSWVPDVLAAADSHHALGERDARDALLSEAVALAEHWGTPGLVGQARHRSARLAGGDDAADRLEGAIGLLRESPARLELARALLSLGEVLRRTGRRVESRAPLRQAYDLARRCGAAGLAETCRTELRASGVQLRREALTGADALTASERRVAELAAGGASNVDIAQTLFLTVKTVESHLSNAYRKLEIGRRSQLPAALAPRSSGS